MRLQSLYVFKPAVVACFMATGKIGSSIREIGIDGPVQRA